MWYLFIWKLYCRHCVMLYVSSAVTNFLKLATTPSLPSGARNIEYAHHCLYRAGGDIEVRRIPQPPPPPPSKSVKNCRTVNRAFSRDVMLSSNMAASIATEINIHLCKHLFTLLCVMVSPWTSPFVVQAHIDRVCAWCTWLPWISRSVCAIRRPCGQHDVGKNALYASYV